jgi:hypothetical protein
MFAKLRFPILSLALAAILAPASFADGFGFAWTHRIKHSALSFVYSSGPVFSDGWTPGFARRCAPEYWVPGHYETVCRQVWVEGCARTAWVEPIYAWRSDGCGRPCNVCIASGHYAIVRQSGHFETRRFQVWIEGRWQS